MANEPKDKIGFGQLRLKEVKLGDRVQVDDGFTCIEAWGIRQVCQDLDGDLYIPCFSGAHYLTGQLDKHGKLVGIRVASEISNG